MDVLETGSKSAYHSDKRSTVINGSIEWKACFFFMNVESNLSLLRFCFNALSLCDWLEKVTPLSQPMRLSQIKTAVARVFPRLAPVYVFASNSDWFIVLFASVVIGQSNCFQLVLVLRHSIEHLCNKPTYQPSPGIVSILYNMAGSPTVCS